MDCCARPRVSTLNDYDRIADDIQKAISELCENITLKATDDASNARAVVSDALINVISHLHRTKRWCEGLAEGHRMYAKPTESPDHDQ